MWGGGRYSLWDTRRTKLIAHHGRWACIRRAIMLQMRIWRRLRRVLGGVSGGPIETGIVLLWSLRSRSRQHGSSLTRGCPETIFSRSRPLGWDYGVGLIDGTVEGRRRVSHATILHPLYLLILELRRVHKGVCRGAHEGAGVEHVRSHVGVIIEMAEGRAIVILDGSGVVHPGAHIREAGWLPICKATRCQQSQWTPRHRHIGIGYRQGQK